jgi:hypothetical protein
MVRTGGLAAIRFPLYAHHFGLRFSNLIRYSLGSRNLRGLVGVSVGDLYHVGDCGASLDRLNQPKVGILTDGERSGGVALQVFKELEAQNFERILCLDSAGALLVKSFAGYKREVQSNLLAGCFLGESRPSAMRLSSFCIHVKSRQSKEPSGSNGNCGFFIA